MGWCPFPVGPVLFLTTIFYLNLTARVILAPLLPVVEAELSVGHGVAGSLFLWIQAGYAAGLMSSGLVSARLRYRGTVLISSLAVGLFLLLTAQAGTLPGLRLGLLLVGAASGLYLPAGISVVTELTEERHWGKALALHEVGPNLGFITAPLLAELTLGFLSWRGALALLGIASLLGGGAFALWGKGGEPRGEAPRPEVLGRLLANPSAWAGGLLFTVGVGGGMGIYTMLTLFLVSETGLPRGWANLLTGTSRLLSISMLPATGVLTDRLGARRAVTACLRLTGVVTLLLGLVRHGVGTPLLVLLQSTCAVLFFPPAFALVSGSLPPSLRGLGVSFATAMGSILGGGGVPSGIGYLAEARSFGTAFTLMGLFTLAAPLLLRLYGRRVPDKN